jgi:hypothetical protein
MRMFRFPSSGRIFESAMTENISKLFSNSRRRRFVIYMEIFYQDGKQSWAPRRGRESKVRGIVQSRGKSTGAIVSTTYSRGDQPTTGIQYINQSYADCTHIDKIY